METEISNNLGRSGWDKEGMFMMTIPFKSGLMTSLEAAVLNACSMQGGLGSSKVSIWLT